MIRITSTHNKTNDKSKKTRANLQKDNTKKKNAPSNNHNHTKNHDATNKTEKPVKNKQDNDIPTKK